MPYGPTARLGLSGPLGTEMINQGDDSIRALLDRLDAVLAPVSSGLFANRPASSAGTPGITDRVYHATDIGLSFRDTGTGWVPIGIPIGGTVGWISTGDLTPELVVAEGRLLTSANYPALDALIGAAAPVGRTHLWNGGTSPGIGQFRIPNYAGRARVAPDPGNAVIPNSNRAVGQTGGEERHTLIASESGTNGSGSTAANSGAHDHQMQGQQNNSPGTQAVPYMPGGHAPDSTFWNVQYPGGSPNGSHSHPLAARDADSPHNNMQPYVVENVLVRII